MKGVEMARIVLTGETVLTFVPRIGSRDVLAAFGRALGCDLSTLSMGGLPIW